MLVSLGHSRTIDSQAVALAHKQRAVACWYIRLPFGRLLKEEYSARNAGRLLFSELHYLHCYPTVTTLPTATTGFDSPLVYPRSMSDSSYEDAFEDAVNALAGRTDSDDLAYSFLSAANNSAAAQISDALDTVHLIAYHPETADAFGTTGSP